MIIILKVCFLTYPNKKFKNKILTKFNNPERKQYKYYVQIFYFLK